jgi:glycosyltransferase involved in cell wall biosynthesis
MRIAVWHNLSFGGAKRALYYHLKAFKEEGHYLEIWNPMPQKTCNINLSEFGIEHECSINFDTAKIRNHYRHPQSISETKKIIQLLKKHQSKCAEQINRENFDIVFVNSCSVTYMPFIGEFLEAPSILYLGEPYRWLYEANPENIWQAPSDSIFRIRNAIKDYRINYSYRIQVRQEIESARKYNKILVNSNYSKESLLKAYGIEPEVCRLGVDTTLFNISAGKKENYVVGSGLLHPPKGADRAVFLLSKINAGIRPSLHWISNGNNQTYLNSLTEYSKSLGVNFIPFINISDHDLIKELSLAKFMIYTPRLEPLGLAPLEANACGTFVIGIAEGGVRETISNGINGFLINNVNDDRFIGYAEKLLINDDSAEKLGSQARDFVLENWSFQHLKNNIVKAINIFN